MRARARRMSDWKMTMTTSTREDKNEVISQLVATMSSSRLTHQVNRTRPRPVSICMALVPRTSSII